MRKVRGPPPTCDDSFCLDDVESFAELTLPVCAYLRACYLYRSLLVSTKAHALSLSHTLTHSLTLTRQPLRGTQW